MATKVVKRFPEVRTLWDILPKGAEGGREFARVVDLLIFQEARRQGISANLFSDVAGDYYGLDSFEYTDHRRTSGTTGYQYKFFPSPLSANHRSEIKESLNETANAQEKLKLKKWIIVTPQDFVESANRADGGDVSWFETLKQERAYPFAIEHWGHKNLVALFLETPSLCLYYYPELIAEGSNRRDTIQKTRSSYDTNLLSLNRNIEFVGTSVYKPEATKGVPLENIYIPLSVAIEAAGSPGQDAPAIDPVTLLASGSPRVILGDPGCGKSTLLRFLALAGISRPLQKRYKTKPDKRLPILVILRRYSDELKSNRNLSLIDYIRQTAMADFNLRFADSQFFAYYLESGQAILLFDGLDELPTIDFKQLVRDRIQSLHNAYPGNTIVVTSRVVGYEGDLRFPNKEFLHYKVAPLGLREIEQFLKDWYAVRVENETERDSHVGDLTRLLEDEHYSAIRELASNPLLLTIIALVHRIDAVLPDERVVLYQKCTETLLNTWHTWKFRGSDVKNRGRVERRNRRRIEEIAYWIQCRSSSSAASERTVVPAVELRTFLVDYIGRRETNSASDEDPEDLADQFIDFVKKRAGLLIEIGDSQFSFIHLTFQEYLASCRIITASERGGVDAIWKTLRERFDDARWHEVIRLLLAELKAEESQEVLLDNILKARGLSAQGTVRRDKLLGGLLLDAIPAAETKKDEILKRLLRAGARTGDQIEFRSLTGTLSRYNAKREGNVDDLKESLVEAAAAIRPRSERIALSLSAEILGIKPDFEQIDGWAALSDELTMFFGERPLDTRHCPTLQKSLDLFRAVQDEMVLTAPLNNFIVAATMPVWDLLGGGILSRRLFELFCISFFSGETPGPFHDFGWNLSALYGSGLTILQRISEDGGLGRNRHTSEGVYVAAKAVEFELRNAAVLAPLREEVERGDPKRRPEFGMINVLRNKARARVRQLEKTLRRNVGQLLDGLEKTSSPLRGRASQGIVDAWPVVLATPSYYEPIVDTIVSAFGLLPEPQWREALRISGLRHFAHGLSQFNAQVPSQTEGRFGSLDSDNAQSYSAAWQLIYDSWLYTYGAFEHPVESPFAYLAMATGEAKAPSVRLAHCIRRIIMGDESRVAELGSMVNSQDSEWTSLFYALR